MVGLVNLRLHIGPIERQKTRECKVTLNGGGVSEMALPAHGAAMRIRFMGTERVVNLNCLVSGVCNVAVKTLMASRVRLRSTWTSWTKVHLNGCALLLRKPTSHMRTSNKSFGATGRKTTLVLSAFRTLFSTVNSANQATEQAVFTQSPPRSTENRCGRPQITSGFSST